MEQGTNNPKWSIDWQSLEHEYVTGGNDVSLRSLAKKHRINFAALLLADKRLQGLQDVFMEALAELSAAKPGAEKQFQATAVGILLDKLHKELDRAGDNHGDGQQGSPRAFFEDDTAKFFELCGVLRLRTKRDGVECDRER